MKKIIKYWKKSKIRTQIIFTYILILLLSFVMTFSMIWAVNNKYTKEEIGKAGVQTVSALHGNLALVFENVTQLSTYLYFDDIVQDSLRQINSANIDLNYQKNITKSLFNMILSGDYVSGVYIFDQYNNCYSSYKRTPRKVSALHGNLALVFENVTQLSTYLYFDDIVQDSLRQINSANIDLNYQKNITKSLFNMILSGDYVSGVYIFDQYNNCYSSYKRTPRKVNKYIQGADWYKKMQSAGGNGFFYKGSDGTIEYYENNNYLCYVRQILDKKDYKPLATLLITFDNTVLQGYFNQVSEDSKNQFYIIDSKGNYVIKPQEEKRDFKKYTKVAENINEGYKEVKNNGEECIVACQDMGIQDWKLVGVFSMDDITSLAPYYSTIIAIIMGINIIFVFLCSTLLTYLIFKPLRKIENHMQIVENGEFITMPVDDYDNEITNLRKVFNHMILSVKALMKRVKDEERIIAKGKLDIIYAQINPHFLYNTLDAISALALMEENEKCFQMIQALGNFYKNSLNSGLDYISVEDEIGCIESYITILNTRYENQIAISYDIEDAVKHEKVLKLLLQPLVENAVHHGLNGEGGNIEIKVFEQEDEIIFIVSDDGVGMSDEKIEDILAGRTVTGKSGFGLYSLIQRIRLTYGIENPVIIQSEVGVGTEIIVTIKKIKMEK